MLSLHIFNFCILFVGLGLLESDASLDISDRFATDKFFSQPEKAKEAQMIVNKQRKFIASALSAAGVKAAGGGNTDIRNSKNLESPVLDENTVQNGDTKNVDKIHKDLENGGHMDYSKRVDQEGRTHSDWEVDVAA